MDIRPIKTDDDYRAALAEVETYFDNEPALGSPEGDRFTALANAIEAYENEHYPMTDTPLQTTRWDVTEHLDSSARRAGCLEAIAEDGDPTLVAAAADDVARAKAKKPDEE